MDFRLLLCTGFYLLGVPFHWMPRVRMVPQPQLVERTYSEVAGQPRPLPSAQPV
jgi:hypothetical protein